MKIYDVIGIGFGPSNIALAIALDEQRQKNQHIDTLFIEKQPHFAWHKNMLLNGTDMQISFLKDLITLRNPRSHFTFTNYLFEKGRLQDFINLKTFFPSRHEFNDYLAWAANQFDDRCIYNEEVIEVLPEKRGSEVSLLNVITRNTTGKTREYLTRNLVVSIGGTPNIPECFKAARGDLRVFHSNDYLSSMERLERTSRIAIIGGGQSAAEIFLDLHGHPGSPCIDLIMRGRAMHPSDDSPSVNEIFNIEFTDYMFSRSPEERAILLQEFRNTNYAAPDLDQIEEIFSILYAQKVTGRSRHRLLTQHETQEVFSSGAGVQLQLMNLDIKKIVSRSYDAVILATGYTRHHHKTILKPLANYLPGFEVDRHYRLRRTSDFSPTIFVQGASEATHGISDTLLSILPVRTQEIGEAITNIMGQELEHIPEKRETA